MIRALIAAALLLTSPLSAATITVNSNLDGTPAADASCTLREAIIAANTDTAFNGCAAGSGADTIAFAIGSGAQGITLLEPLPDITETVTIDGTTQPGYSGAPLIVVNGGGTISHAFSIVPGGDGSSILAIEIEDFSTDAIRITSSSNTLQNVRIHDGAGGIEITGSATAPATNNVIDRVYIHGIEGEAVRLIGAQSTLVTRSQFGEFFPDTGSTGSAVYIESSATAAATGNQIGTAAAGNRFISNGTAGPPATAVTIISGTGNSVIGNSMQFNGIPTTGIDLGGNGPTANDSCDADVGPNLLQNKPVVTHAIFENNTMTIRGTLNSTASSTFTLHFYFSGAASFDQGTHYIGSTIATTNATCTATFQQTFAFTPPSQEGTVIATATDAANNTSEQSGPAVLVAALQVAKAFAPDAVVRTGSPSVSRLTITITHPTYSALTEEVTNLAVNDAYPAGIRNAPTPDAQTTCGGTVTAAAGGTSLALSGGTLAEGTSCTVSVNVVATQDGELQNLLPAGAVTGTFSFGPSQTENVQPAMATLNATSSGPVVVTKAFTPATVEAGTPTTLTITLSNPHTIGLTNVSFTDAYPAGLVNATPANASATCGGTLTAANGGNSISLAGATLPAGATCTVTVSVLAPASGTISNTIPAGSVTTAEGETNDASTTGVLVVAPGETATIPTASEWALLALAMMLGMIGVGKMR